MADLSGELGLDVKAISESLTRVEAQLDKFTKSTVKTNAAVGKIQATFGAFAKAANALGIALSGAAIVTHIKSLKELGSELESTRAKYTTGSEAAKNFDEATGGAGDDKIIRIKKIGAAYDNFFLKLKNGAALVGNAVVNLFQPGKYVGESERAKEAPDTNYYEQIIAIEDKIAGLRQNATKDMQDQREILDAEIQLEILRLAYANKADGLSRAEENAARQAYGEKKRQKSEEDFQRAQEVEAAEKQTQLLREQITGQQSASKFTEIRLRYERQIAEALKAGKEDLAGQLTIQKNMEMMEAKRAAHTMSPRERLDERRALRKTNRENKQTRAAEDEFQSRWDRGARPDTPGSEFAKWAANNAQPAAMGNPAQNTEGKAAIDAAQTLRNIETILKQ